MPKIISNSGMKCPFISRSTIGKIIWKMMKFSKASQYFLVILAFAVGMICAWYPYIYWNNSETEWVREQYCLDFSCVPRKITSWREMFVLSHSAFIPSFPEGLSGWKLQIKMQNEANQIPPVTIHEIVSKLPVRDKEFTLLCIGATAKWSAIGNAIWTGVTLLEILQMRSIYWTTGYNEVHLIGRDGYIASLPLESLGKLWLVWKMNGHWLSAEHGFPVRIIAPSYYGTKNVKWIERIEFVSQSQHHVDIFELQGWPTDHNIRPVSFIYYPGQFSRISRPSTEMNSLRITGIAYCGSQEVDKVLIGINNGDQQWNGSSPSHPLTNSSWITADIIQKGASDVWSLWKVDVPYDWRGIIQVFSKVQCVDGRATNETWENDMGGWYGVGSTIFEIC